MKVGILTFHWATNYGAILQAFCLQNYLLEQGHDVAIINYKPSQYDFSWLSFVKHPGKLKSFFRILMTRKKEKQLSIFRNKYLNLSSRLFSVKEVDVLINDFDVLISGSDQVLNPSFTMTGDNGKPSPVYWLGIGKKNTIRVGYSVSFGCSHYPEIAANVAMKLVNVFDAIGVRENTGLAILDQLNFKGVKEILPDPTILYGKQIFEKINVVAPFKKGDYTCVYMLRHEIRVPGNVVYIDEKHKPLSMEQWLKTIINARQLVTNSYHGMIMALITHVPFVVLLETGKGSGMNDRFYTLLGRLHLENRAAQTIEEALSVLEFPMSFDIIETELAAYRSVGVDFLREYLS